MADAATRLSAGIYRRCGCKDPATGRRFGRRCPRLGTPGHGNWYFAVQATDRRGRCIRLRRGGYGSSAAARAARARLFDRDLHSRFGVVATVHDWLYSWLADIDGKVRPTTWQSNHSHVTEYLSPENRPDSLAGLDVRADSAHVRWPGIAAQPIRRPAVAGDAAAGPGNTAPQSQHGCPRTRTTQQPVVLPGSRRPRPAARGCGPVADRLDYSGPIAPSRSAAARSRRGRRSRVALFGADGADEPHQVWVVLEPFAMAGQAQVVEAQVELVLQSLAGVLAVFGDDVQ